MTPHDSPSSTEQTPGITRRQVLRLMAVGSAAAMVVTLADGARPVAAFAAVDGRAPLGPSTATNANSADLLDVFGRRTDPGAEVIQWPASGTDNQKWVFTRRADGWVTITSHNSGLPLDLERSATADGTRVVQWTAAETPSQQWRIEDAGDGQVTIRNRASGTLLTVSGDSSVDGAEIVIRTDSGHASQRWLLAGPEGSEGPFVLDVTQTEARTDDVVPNAGGVAAGVTYAATRNGWSRDGRAWFPVSGEFHYVRYPAGSWDRELGKLRAAGVSIVATYVFWNHHEAVQGTWDWSGDRDLRGFVEAAQRQGLQLWLRVGPYVNAEAVNGGIPEFALGGARSNDAGYLAKVDAYFGRIAEQLSGLWAKDGGPIVGIQLENEFATGDPAHITRLRRMCEQQGMLVPFYTVTANSNFDDDIAIPLQGSYSYRGWETAGGTGPVSGYVYGTDEWTANTDIGGARYDTLRYPRGYCELGTGSPMRGNDRFRVEAKYVVAQAYDSVGRGANYLGYYMFHGGTQVPGLTGDWPLTYDFQAPIGEFGQTRTSYAEYRRLHTFLDTCADELVRTRVVRDEGQILDPAVTWRPRFIGRFDADGRGFVFVNNTQRNVRMTPIPDFQVQIATREGTVTVPRAPLTLPVDVSAFFPFMTDLGGVDLRWATVQPLAKLDGGDLPTWVYWAPSWAEPTLAFPADAVVHEESGTTRRSTEDGELRVGVSADERTSLIVGDAGEARRARIVVLTEAESLAASVTRIDGRDRLVVMTGGQISGLLPQPRFSGAAGAAVTVEMLPSTGLAPSAQWSSVASAAPFGAFRTELPGAGPAPAVTPTATGRWRIAAGEDQLRGLAEARLVVDYRGGRAALLAGTTTITNDFFHGETWTLDLLRLTAAQRADLTLQVDHWDDAIVGVSRPAAAMQSATWSWEPITDVRWSGDSVETTVKPRLVAGSVQLTVSVRNTGDRALAIGIDSLYGKKSFPSILPGKNASAAFSTRTAGIAPGVVTISAAHAGREVLRESASYDAL